MPEFNHSYNSRLEVGLLQGKEKGCICFAFQSTFKYLYSEARNTEFITP